MKGIDQLLAEAQDAYNNNRLEDALLMLQDEKLKDNEQALFLKGEVYYKLQKWGDALNCFTLCLGKDSLDLKAKAYIELIRSILGFHHKDFFNP